MLKIFICCLILYCKLGCMISAAHEKEMFLQSDVLTKSNYDAADTLKNTISLGVSTALLDDPLVKLGPLFSTSFGTKLNRIYYALFSVDYLFGQKFSKDDLAERKFSTNKSISNVYLSMGIGRQILTLNKLSLDFSTSISCRKYSSAESSVFSKYFPYSNTNIMVSETSYLKRWSLGNINTLRLLYSLKSNTIGFVARYEFFKDKIKFAPGLQLARKL